MQQSNPNIKHIEDAMQERVNQMKQALEKLDISKVGKAGELIVDAFKKGNKLFAFGNGGSAAQAMHLTEELIGKYSECREPYPAICLNSDVGALTCIANDFGYAEIFHRQLEALYKHGDVSVLISTSGHSRNIVNALEYLTEAKSNFIALTGEDGGKFKYCNSGQIINVKSKNPAIVQEVHMVIIHLLVEHIEKNLS